MLCACHSSQSYWHGSHCHKAAVELLVMLQYPSTTQTIPSVVNNKNHLANTHCICGCIYLYTSSQLPVTLYVQIQQILIIPRDENHYKLENQNYLRHQAQGVGSRNLRLVQFQLRQPVYGIALPESA